MLNFLVKVMNFVLLAFTSKLQFFVVPLDTVIFGFPVFALLFMLFRLLHVVVNSVFVVFSFFDFVIVLVFPFMTLPFTFFERNF